jgi:hypothetical protein
MKYTLARYLCFSIITPNRVQKVLTHACWQLALPSYTHVIHGFLRRIHMYFILSVLIKVRDEKFLFFVNSTGCTGGGMNAVLCIVEMTVELKSSRLDLVSE